MMSIINQFREKAPDLCYEERVLIGASFLVQKTGDFRFSFLKYLMWVLIIRQQYLRGAPCFLEYLQDKGLSPKENVLGQLVL